MKDIKAMDDYALVKGYIGGADECFTELVTRYKSLVFSIVLRMTGSREGAEDLAQEVFIKIAQNMGKYQPEFKFATWVMRISANHCIDHRRKKRAETVPIEDMEFALAAPDDETPEAAYIADERSRTLNSLIDKLPDIYKNPIIMYHKDNLSYQEISEALSEPLSKVKNRIFRGRKMLREMLLIGREAGLYAM